MEKKERKKINRLGIMKKNINQTMGGYLNLKLVFTENAKIKTLDAYAITQTRNQRVDRCLTSEPIGAFLTQNA